MQVVRTIYSGLCHSDLLHTIDGINAYLVDMKSEYIIYILLVCSFHSVSESMFPLEDLLFQAEMITVVLSVITQQTICFQSAVVPEFIRPVAQSCMAVHDRIP